ncbi:MAG: hypothetical protein KGH94_02420 [Candidatus Micrarchaeota archaeon]|nr:hypothetical protein [Candidatus Micrarchaeota archaeon]
MMGGRMARSQMAMEYLIVYGIALLITLIAIFVLYTVFGTPQKSTLNTCTFSGGATCSDLVLSANTITSNTAIMVLLNNAGDQPIVLPSIRININGVNSSYVSCLPKYVKAGGSVVCTINITDKSIVGQQLSGKFYLSEQNCAFSGSVGSCANAVNQIYSGSFYGTIQSSGTNPNFVISLQPTQTLAGNVTGFGSAAGQIIVNLAGTLAYVSTTGTAPSGTVNVITLSSLAITNTIAAQGAGNMALNPSGTQLYVPSSWATPNYMTIISTSNNVVIGTPSMGTSPEAPVFSPSGSLAYVADLQDGNIRTISTATLQVVNTISFAGSGAVTFGITVNPSGSLIYAPIESGSTVNVISTTTNSVVNTITVGSHPYPVVFNPSGTLAYVPNAGIGSNSVSVIDVAANTVSRTISVGCGPDVAVFSPNGGNIYVSDSCGNTISVINATTNSVTTVQVGAASDTSPRVIIFNPSGTMAYVNNYAAGTISAINTKTYAVSTITVGGLNSEPCSLALNPVGSVLYVLDCYWPFPKVVAINTGQIGPPATNQKYPVTALLTVSGNPIKGATINFSTSNPTFQVSPRYVSTNSSGEATSYVWGSTAGTATVYANFSNTVSTNVIIGLK